MRPRATRACRRPSWRRSRSWTDGHCSTTPVSAANPFAPDEKKPDRSGCAECRCTPLCDACHKQATGIRSRKEFSLQAFLRYEEELEETSEDEDEDEEEEDEEEDEERSSEAAGYSTACGSGGV